MYRVMLRGQKFKCMKPVGGFGAELEILRIIHGISQYLWNSHHEMGIILGTGVSMAVGHGQAPEEGAYLKVRVGIFKLRALESSGGLIKTSCKVLLQKLDAVD